MSPLKSWLWFYIVLSGLGLLCACAPWHVQTDVPAASTAFDSTKVYRVTLQNGSKEVATHPRIAGDSLTWVEPPNPDAPKLAPKHLAVPLSEIQQMEIQGSSDAGTIAAIVLAAAFLKFVLSGGGNPSSW